MGKNVLVIGASGEIGISIAKRLAEDGHQLILHYNQNEERISELRKQLNNNSILTAIQADLSNELEIEKFLSKLVFSVDMIVFASGRAQYGVFHETSKMIMDEMLTLHVKAPWLITKALLPSMLHKKYGKIILISSIWGEVGASYEVIYSTVKGAQNSFVKALAKEVAPSGISVNGISPGFIETKMNHHLSEEEKEILISDIPMNRAGKPDEISHVVSFLLDDRSSYIQGEIIRVTGAW
ncbi:SDR family oxidoreductase [Oceanobacillus sp. 143]|uniref:3-ketoacyl-ACP reductase n=1 Tax=Oceanobacillus zhaokaii TaxID=2052660 RepID=A0A345PGL3_9BACI|nr:SDR family oxidoreductase [Oceanobacillus zhaokaii]AXI09143.1 3-ketoacyl-ACP reductase [Oceanobacillus zhaokaii]QGS68685.1 SDR family oxidoreductase [Oceanobacillus sp. 143]